MRALVEATFTQLSCAPMRSVWIALFCAALLSCAALRDDLRRAEQAFGQARYENAQVWLTDLEPSVPQMDKELRARFYYLYGMTAFRTGDKVRARHYLALCRAEAGDTGLGLTPDWRTNLVTTLSELDAG